jgi:glyoxylate reductase
MRRADVLVPCITDQIDAGPSGAGGGPAEADRELRRGGRPYRCRHRAAAGHPGVEHARRVTEDTADMTMALILAVTGGCRKAGGDAGGRLGRVGAHRLHGRAGRRQAAGHPGHGADRAGGGAAGAAFGMQVHYHNRSACAPRWNEIWTRPGGRALTRWSRRMDVIVDQLPAYAVDLPPDERAAAEADEALGGDREHLARGGDRRERADPDAAGGRDRGGGAGRLREGARSTRG